MNLNKNIKKNKDIDFYLKKSLSNLIAAEEDGEHALQMLSETKLLKKLIKHNRDDNTSKTLKKI